MVVADAGSEEEEMGVVVVVVVVVVLVEEEVWWVNGRPLPLKQPLAGLQAKQRAGRTELLLLLLLGLSALDRGVLAWLIRTDT